jgi:hypothetical protein
VEAAKTPRYAGFLLPGVMPGLICVLGPRARGRPCPNGGEAAAPRSVANDGARAHRAAFSVSSWTAKVWGLPGRAKEECNTCRGSKRPTLFRKASFLSSSKAALPGGLRHFARLRGKDSNLDYLIHSRDSKQPLRPHEHRFAGALQGARATPKYPLFSCGPSGFGHWDRTSAQSARRLGRRSPQTWVAAR